MLPCIAAVATATFIGTKTLKSNASENNALLIANMEALSQSSDSFDPSSLPCYSDFVLAKGCSVILCDNCCRVDGKPTPFARKSTCGEG